MTKEIVDYHSYKIGSNISGEIIEDIFYITDDYIIYQLKGSKVVAFEYNDDETYDPRYGEIAEDVSRVNGLISTNGEANKFLMRIADAIDAGLNGHEKTATSILQNLERTIQNHKIIKGRLIYSFSCLSFVILNTVIVLTLVTFSQSLPIVNNLNMYFIITLCGSLGGYLSVSIKMKELNIDIDSGRGIYVLSGLSRMFISAISAIILYIIIMSNAFLGFINSIAAENRYYVICGLAVIAGFSESFVPDILKKIEKKETEKS